MSDKNFSEISQIIDQIGREKGIDKSIVVEALTQGLLLAARKKYGTYREIEAQYNPETGEVDLYEFKEVVSDEKFIDEEVEIKYTEAIVIDPDAKISDTLGFPLDKSDLGRIAVQTARQVVIQKVRDAEREIIFAEFEQRKGEIASGVVRRIERGAIVVDLGRTEAYIPRSEQIAGENYSPGERIQGYILEVRQSQRGPQIIMSRGSGEYMAKLFELEVPEIREGIVDIVCTAREPGYRGKIAVRSNDSSVDPVGACVGMKGSRVHNVIQELKGERIDIVLWNEDPAYFACKALAPAEIIRVFMDEEAREMEVVVQDDQLSLAIGKKGQNVRLAAKLTGWKLDILSQSNLAVRTAEAIFNLMLLPSVNETMAQSIYQSGIGTFQALAESSVENIMKTPGYETEEKAAELLKEAQGLVAKYHQEGTEVPSMPPKEEPKPEPEEAPVKADSEEKVSESEAAPAENEEAVSSVTESTDDLEKVEASPEEEAVPAEEEASKEQPAEESEEAPAEAAATSEDEESS